MDARLLVAMALAALLSLGARCSRPFSTIVVDEPISGALYDDPVPVVEAAARVGTNFDLATIEVRIDGVDLLSALGLVPPFSDAAGVVSIGGTNVSLSEFSFTGSNPRLVHLVASGLPLGSHLLEVEGTKIAAQVVTDAAAFEVIGPLSLEAEVLASSGLNEAPLDFGVEGFLLNATLGQPFAAPPVVLSGGGELRPGFVEVSEALIAGGTP